MVYHPRSFIFVFSIRIRNRKWLFIVGAPTQSSFHNRLAAGYLLGLDSNACLPVSFSYSRSDCEWTVQPSDQSVLPWLSLVPCIAVRAGRVVGCPAANGAWPINLPHSPEDSIRDQSGLHRTPPRYSDSGFAFGLVSVGNFPNICAKRPAVQLYFRTV